MTTNYRDQINESVLSNAVTTSGAISTTPIRVRGLYVRSAAGAGTVVLKNGGSGGTAQLTLNTPASAGAQYIALPGAGMSFATDCYATLTTADGLTVFYS